MTKLPKNLFSLEAEQEVIGAIMARPDALDDVLEVIEPADLYHIDHQRIIESAIRLRDSGKPFDGVSVFVELDGMGKKDTAMLAIECAQNAAGSSNVKTYARIVSERSKLRNLQSALQEANEKLASSQTAAEALDFAQSKLIELDSRDYNAEIQEANPVIKRVVAAIDHRFTNRQNGIFGGLATGLTELDEQWQGMRDGHLIILAARPGMGKSALGLQFVQHCALVEKKAALVFSLEMPTDECFERMTSAQGRLDYSRIRNGDFTEDDWPKLQVGISKLKDAPIFTVDTPSLHVNQVRAYARKCNRKHNLGLVLVDHINIMRGDGQAREREVASISGGLKALAKEINCPVVALCQLNRDCESRQEKRPMMSDLRESGAIEQDADIVTFLYRDDYYHKDTNRPGVIELLTRKFRGGATGDVYLTNNLRHMRMDNLAGYVPPKEPTKTGAKVFNLGG